MNKNHNAQSTLISQILSIKLKVAKEHLTDAIDILNGWYPEDEENIPADMIFEGEPDDKD